MHPKLFTRSFFPLVLLAFLLLPNKSAAAQCSSLFNLTVALTELSSTQVNGSGATNIDGDTLLEFFAFKIFGPGDVSPNPSAQGSCGIQVSGGGMGSSSAQITIPACRLLVKFRVTRNQVTCEQEWGIINASLPYCQGTPQPPVQPVSVVPAAVILIQ